MGILDFLFPKYCINCKKLGSYLCDNCFAYLSFDTSGFCLVCGRSSIDGLTHPGCKGRYTIDGAFSAIVYKGVAKKLVYQFKYKPYLTDLKMVLSDLFYEALIQKEEFNTIIHPPAGGSPILVPIPLHESKLKSRGYNQAEILANALAQSLKLNPSASLRARAQNLLERTRNTKSQVGLKEEERRENISKAFRVKPNIQITQCPNILLVDDVLTTGSTLLEAAKILKRNGAKRVWGLALARDA